MCFVIFLNQLKFYFEILFIVYRCVLQVCFLYDIVAKFHGFVFKCFAKYVNIFKKFYIKILLFVYIRFLNFDFLLSSFIAHGAQLKRTFQSQML